MNKVLGMMDYCIVIHQFINLSIFLLQLHVYKREKIKPFTIFYCHPQNADKTIPICDTIPLNSTLDNREGKNDMFSLVFAKNKNVRMS